MIERCERFIQIGMTTLGGMVFVIVAVVGGLVVEYSTTATVVILCLFWGVIGFTIAMIHRRKKLIRHLHNL